MKIYDDSDPVQTILKMVNVVAVDHTSAKVSNLSLCIYTVASYRQGKGEKVSVSVSRFRGLTACQLLHTGVSPQFKLGPVLAIMLFSNANLEEGTVINLQL